MVDVEEKNDGNVESADDSDAQSVSKGEGTEGEIRSEQIEAWTLTRFEEALVDVFARFM